MVIKLFSKKNRIFKMNLLKKTLVAAGVATAVLATGAAQAATVNNPTVSAAGVVNTVASKFVANESVKTVLDLPTITLSLGATETLSVDDSVTFTLNTGVFASVGTVASTLTGGLSLISGGVKSNTAVYRVTTAASGPAADITMTGASVTGTLIATNSPVTTSVAMSGFVGGAAQSLFSSPVTTYSMQLVPVMSATIVGAAGTFDVAAGFSALTTGTGTTSATTGVSTTTGAAVITTTAGVGSTVGANTTGIPATVPAPSSTLVTISGPMTGVSAIIDGNILATSAAGVPTAGATAGTFTIDTANNTATGTQIATGAGSLTMSFAGTMAYDASAYTATVSRLADGAAYAANASIGSGTLFAFTQNGSAFITTSFGSMNKLTVTDRSGALGGAGADGGIAISAYGADGAAVTCTGLTIANLPNNGTTTIQGADVTAACAGAKRIEGIVNSSSILVTNTKIAADGATSQSGLGTGNSTVAN
jgi:hypothetical protein